MGAKAWEKLCLFFVGIALILFCGSLLWFLDKLDKVNTNSLWLMHMRSLRYHRSIDWPHLCGWGGDRRMKCFVTIYDWFPIFRTGIDGKNTIKIFKLVSYYLLLWEIGVLYFMTSWISRLWVAGWVVWLLVFDWLNTLWPAFIIHLIRH